MKTEVVANGSTCRFCGTGAHRVTSPYRLNNGKFMSCSCGKLKYSFKEKKTRQGKY